MNVDVFVVELPSADLRNAPEDELLFYLQTGLIANEINILTKYSLFARPKNPEHKVVDDAGFAASSFMCRLLSGKCFEAYKAIQLHGKLMRTYRDSFNASQKEQLSYIHSFFGKKANTVTTTRNKVAFHNDLDFLRAGIPTFLKEEGHLDYLTVEQGNTFFMTSENLLLHATYNSSELDDPKKAFEQILDEQLSIAAALLTVAFGICRVFYQRNFQPNPIKNEQRITLNAVSDLLDIQLPFFAVPLRKT
ncbi:MAG: hypothetical protein AAF683_07890 [Pseudomonadota bacterium]